MTGYLTIGQGELNAIALEGRTNQTSLSSDVQVESKHLDAR